MWSVGVASLIYALCLHIITVSVYPNAHLIFCLTHAHTHTCTPQMYPMAVVGTASRGLVVYQLEGTPSEFRV